MFEKKGKRLLVNSEDDDFSICSSELSAWDSDVESISSLADCAREWREGAHFCAPGEAMLQLALVTAVVSCGPRAESSVCVPHLGSSLGVSACGWHA